MNAPAPLHASFSFPTDYRLGAGRRRELASAVRALGSRRPLIVSDPGVARLPWFPELLDQLRTELGLSQTATFTDLAANPTDANVRSGCEAYVAAKCDGIVCIGGGAAMDAGKAVAVMVSHDGRSIDYEDIGDRWTKIDGDRIAPIVALPTTAGTGSEVGRASVIADELDGGRKAIIFHPRMLPRTVIADPELTVGLPAHLTASTGLDAFVHCFEALCAPGYHPMAEGIALEGMALIAEHLPRAYHDGEDVQARTHMLMAASMGAVAFQKGLGLVHAISHALGAVANLHHGLANAILLPYCMAFNAETITGACDRICRRIGRPEPGVSSLIDWTLELRHRLGIPEGLATCLSIDWKAEHRERTIALALEDAALTGNPKPATATDIGAVLDRALSGRLDH